MLQCPRCGAKFSTPIKKENGTYCPNDQCGMFVDGVEGLKWVEVDEP